jgi:hypothetical protein
MSFKEGDQVICINNGHLGNLSPREELILYNIYKVKIHEGAHIELDDDQFSCSYRADRFISYKEYTWKKEIEEICLDS